MMTGQKAPAALSGPVSGAYMQQGGSIFSAPVFENNTLKPSELIYSAGGAAIDQIAAGAASGGEPMALTLQLDAKATDAILEGRAVEAVINNPRQVQSAVITAQDSNYGRRDLAMQVLSPTTVLG